VETKTRHAGGRPPIGPEYALKLPAEWLPALDAVARERKTSRAAVIRQALADTYGERLPAVDTEAPRYAPRIAHPEQS
jgi:hypothetical protein